MTTEKRLHMTLGEAIFTQRAIRRLRTDPIPASDLHDILKSATRAPNGGNVQPWHFLVVRDPLLRSKLGKLYHEAWWAKRKDEGINGPQDIPPDNKNMMSAMRLADEIGDAPVIILLCATRRDLLAVNAVIPSVQNLLLSARALGIGGTITTLHPQVESRVHEVFCIPDNAQVVYCVPLGYPRGQFGTAQRKSLEEVCSSDCWGQAATDICLSADG